MNRKNQKRASRGMTIIEVLASIIVALVGVLGVMILIPFAVRQAQTGMDNESASIVARNAFHQFELWGYRNSENWLYWIPPNPPTQPTGIYVPTNREPVSIDPLGIAESGDSSDSQREFGDYTNTSFPFNLAPSAPYTLYPAIPGLNNLDYRIRSVNLRLPPSNPPVPAMTKADARRFCRAADDLAFGDSVNSSGQNDSQLNGPSQLFDTAMGVNARRQSNGRFTWSAIAIPSGANWKLNFLVYRDRETNVTAQDSAPVNLATSPKMRARKVTTPSGPTVDPIPVSNIQIEGEASLKKDEWVMLVNQKRRYPIDPSVSTDKRALVPDDWQIAFYRVVNFQSNAAGSTLTLDGPDYHFQKMEPDPLTGTPRIAYEDTFVVHLKNVVGVYERTIVPEKSSTWNISY